jgi:hypothetical protein
MQFKEGGRKKRVDGGQKNQGGVHKKNCRQFKLMAIFTILELS